MLSSRGIEPIDYLIIGHISQDLLPATGDGTPQSRIGGTVAYAGLTAHALGLRVGVVTSWGEEVQDERLGQIPVFNHPAEQSTIFENIYTAAGRTQILHHAAPRLDLYHIPETWRSAPIVHIAPVAQEVDSGIVRYFRDAQLCMTPQGYLRDWDKEGKVFRTDWPEARYVLRQVDAAIISQEDIQYDLKIMEAMAEAAPTLVVTNGADEIMVFFEGQQHTLQTQPAIEVDPTGAGDIFAAAFFSSLHRSRDPLKAAIFANRVAAPSVERIGLDGIPTQDQINELLTEVF